MSAENFHRVRTLPDYHVTPAWVLHHLAQHEAEHRSELQSLIARLTIKISGDEDNASA